MPHRTLINELRYPSERSNPGLLFSAGLSPNGTLICVTGVDKLVDVATLSDVTLGSTWSSDLKSDDTLPLYSPDGRVIAAVWQSARADLWNAQSRAYLGSVSLENPGLDVIAPGPDGKEALTRDASQHYSLRVVSLGSHL